MDEVAAVMDNVNIADDDSAAVLRKIHEYSCVNKSSKNSCNLNYDNPCFSGLTEEFVLQFKMNMISLPNYEKEIQLSWEKRNTLQNRAL